MSETDRLKPVGPAEPKDPFAGRPAWQKKVEEDAAAYAAAHKDQLSRTEQESKATEQWVAIRHAWARARDIGDVTRGEPLKPEAEELLLPFALRHDKLSVDGRLLSEFGDIEDPRDILVRLKIPRWIVDAGGLSPQLLKEKSDAWESRCVEFLKKIRPANEPSEDELRKIDGLIMPGERYTEFLNRLRLPRSFVQSRTRQEILDALTRHSRMF
jgi:hypothetical protein